MKKKYKKYIIWGIGGGLLFDATFFTLGYFAIYYTGGESNLGWWLVSLNCPVFMILDVGDTKSNSLFLSVTFMYWFAIGYGIFSSIYWIKNKIKNKTEQKDFANA